MNTARPIATIAASQIASSPPSKASLVWLMANQSVNPSLSQRKKQSVKRSKQMFMYQQITGMPPKTEEIIELLSFLNLITFVFSLHTNNYSRVFIFNEISTTTTL